MPVCSSSVVSKDLLFALRSPRYASLIVAMAPQQWTRMRGCEQSWALAHPAAGGIRLESAWLRKEDVVALPSLEEGMQLPKWWAPHAVR